MILEKNDYYRDGHSLHDECERCMHYHTTLIMIDGSMVDGIIEKVDADRVTMMVGEDVMEQDGEENQSDEQRQFHGHMHMRPRRRFRRFRRRSFPFSSLAAVSLLPYPFIPYFLPF